MRTFKKIKMDYANKKIFLEKEDGVSDIVIGQDQNVDSLIQDLKFELSEVKKNASGLKERAKEIMDLLDFLNKEV